MDRVYDRFYESILLGDTDTVRTLIRQHPSLIEEDVDQSLLEDVGSNGHADLFSYLLTTLYESVPSRVFEERAGPLYDHRSSFPASIQTVLRQTESSHRRPVRRPASPVRSVSPSFSPPRPGFSIQMPVRSGSPARRPVSASSRKRSNRQRSYSDSDVDELIDIFRQARVSPRRRR